MEITKVVNDRGETIAANFHAPDGTVLRWKAKEGSGLTVQKLSSKCGRCLVTDNEAESAEVQRMLTHMLGELGERKVISFWVETLQKLFQLVFVHILVQLDRLRLVEHLFSHVDGNTRPDCYGNGVTWAGVYRHFLPIGHNVD